MCIKYVIWCTNLDALDMVKQGLSIERASDASTSGPQVKSYDQIKFWLDFPIVIPI